MINFPDWSCKGIEYLEYIFRGTDFIPSDRLVIQYGINKNRFLDWKLNQIKSIVKKKNKSNYTIKCGAIPQNCLKYTGHAHK